MSTWEMLLRLGTGVGLGSLIGIERQYRARMAGLRTNALVASGATLFVLLSAHGFGGGDADPTRVAAQIVSGIGFLGAGIIIFRRGSVHGLTTAAAVWESAAIGMAAGSGLLLLAVTVTAMHFLVVVGFLPLARWLTSRLSGSVTMHVSYEDGKGVMSRLLQACERRQWQLTDLAADTADLSAASGHVGVLMTLSGRGIVNAPMVLAGIDGVVGIHQYDDDPD